MNLIGVLFSFIVLFLVLNRLKGADPFESLLVRFLCYGTEQPGCSTDFIDAHPEFSRSFDGITRADTHFYLFTPSNKEHPELLHKCPDAIPPKTNFTSDCRTEILVTGALSGVCSFGIFREIKNELLKKGCCNVIFVDYMWGNAPDLGEATQNMRIVADQIIKLINILKEYFNLSPKDFTCTGHSAGAHVCAFVGQGTRIGIINGLDPAGVTITEKTPLNQRLDSRDADCVQVLHTNAGQCLPHLGCNFTCGTVDVWFNNGVEQASAVPQTAIEFAKGDFILGLLSIPVGSHFQVLYYYKASINAEDCKFVAIKCKSYEDFKNGKCSDCGRRGVKCISVGYGGCDCLKRNVRRGKRARNYYLKTDINCPYCDNDGINISKYRCRAH